MSNFSLNIWKLSGHADFLNFCNLRSWVKISHCISYLIKSAFQSFLFFRSFSHFRHHSNASTYSMAIPSNTFSHQGLILLVPGASCFLVDIYTCLVGTKYVWMSASEKEAPRTKRLWPWRKEVLNGIAMEYAEESGCCLKQIRGEVIREVLGIIGMA